MIAQQASRHGVWLKIARLIWVASILLNLSLALFSLPDYIHQVLSVRMSGLNFGGLDNMWTPDNLAAALASLNLTPAFLLISHLVVVGLQMLVFGGVGLLIFWRKSDTWLGLFTSYVLIGIGITNLGSAQSTLAIIPMPWRFIVDLASVLVWPAFFIFFTLFPDGRFVPRWTRYLLPVWIIALVVTEAATVLGNPRVETFTLFSVIPLVVISFGSQVYRYLRVSGPIERQQTKWFMFAILVFIITTLGIQYLVFPSLIRYFQPGTQALILGMIYQVLYMALFLTIPVSIGFAIFRYRLWDVDVIIRRTLIYGILTVALSLVFFGGVVLLQSALGALTGTENSPVAIVFSTLAIAALFSPLRRRVQDFIDRRFYRRKYNAQKTLESFSAAVRNEVELEQLTAHLVTVVQETIQPEQVSLWLVKRSGRE